MKVTMWVDREIIGITYASAASMRASARSRSTSVMASLRAACQRHIMSTVSHHCIVPLLLLTASQCLIFIIRIPDLLSLSDTISWDKHLTRFHRAKSFQFYLGKKKINKIKGPKPNNIPPQNKN